MTEFTGFPEEALDFYEGLEVDNSRTYWTAHKEVYERAVRAPMLALCDVLRPDFGEAKVFRPHRDVRFRADKSPYKTAQGAVFRESSGDGVLYLHVSAAGLFAAAGYHQMAPDQVERYRQAVDDERAGPALVDIVAGLREAGYEVGGDLLKTRPRGYPADHPRLDLLRHRSLTAAKDFGAPAWLHTGAVVEVLRRTWADFGPLNGWLSAHVGASDAPPGRWG